MAFPVFPSTRRAFLLFAVLLSWGVPDASAQTIQNPIQAPGKMPQEVPIAGTANPLPPAANDTMANAATPQAPNPTVLPGAEFVVPLAKPLTPAANPINEALLAFKREQVELMAAEVQRLQPYAPDDYIEYLQTLRKQANAIETAKGDAALLYSPLQERAYFAANDGSAQPYYVMLPVGYTSTKQYPLVVFLHGYTPLISKLNPWIPSSPTLQAAAKRGFIFAIPYGRRNSDFVDWGEDDVRAVRDEVMAHYSVDPDRITLMGTSMGAFGAYAVGLHAPGDWAAVAPISGRTDMFLWFQTSREQLPPWKRVLLEADDPRTLALNARNTPFYIQHGALDHTVPVEHARRFVADAQLYGLPIRYLEDPHADHQNLFQLPAWERAFDWLKKLSFPPPPRQFTFITGNGLQSRANWARVEAFEDYSRTARLDVKVVGLAIEVKTKNIARFTLAPPTSWWKPDQKITLSVNGAPSGDFASQTPIAWQTPDAKLDKFPGHVGPFKNLMRAPFLLVYGSEWDLMAARGFAEEWQGWTDGAAPIKAAKDITAADKAKYNLVLFGTRVTNPLLAEISNGLPLEITPTGYRIGTRQVTMRNVGLRMVYKSPWDAQRLIGVCSGIWWGERLPINHKWDWIPDYIVYGTEFEPYPDDTNKAIEAGWFDGNWALTDATPTATMPK